MGDRPRVGISACLLGEPVRYDGRHKRDAWLVDVLGPQVEWVPVCPEVEAGFGTPREAMHLMDNGRGGLALMTTDTKRDVTETMQRYARGRVDELAGAGLDGYVLKADSPSCGLEGPGLFAAALIARPPKNLWKSVCTGSRLPSSCGRRAPIASSPRDSCSPKA